MIDEAELVAGGGLTSATQSCLVGMWRADLTQGARRLAAARNISAHPGVAVEPDMALQERTSGPQRPNEDAREDVGLRPRLHSHTMAFEQCADLVGKEKCVGGREFGVTAQHGGRQPRPHSRGLVAWQLGAPADVDAPARAFAEELEEHAAQTTGRRGDESAEQSHDAYVAPLGWR